jgi:hypothetical protein
LQPNHPRLFRQTHERDAEADKHFKVTSFDDPTFLLKRVASEQIHTMAAPVPIATYNHDAKIALAILEALRPDFEGTHPNYWLRK